jgi:hypothetical protein
MKFRELETMILERDIPERGLCKGDFGAVVEHETTGRARGIFSYVRHLDALYSEPVMPAQV